MKRLFILLFVMAIGLGLYASITDLSNIQQKGKITQYDPSVYHTSRQGGEDISSAIEIDVLPYNDTGTTSGYSNDYDETCPYSGSTSPDVVYSYTPIVNMINGIVSLCGYTYYDSKLYIYENEATPGAPFACNDDLCTSAAGQGYVSELSGLSFTAGNTYYIVVDGYGGGSGIYEIDFSADVELPTEPILSSTPGFPFDFGTTQFSPTIQTFTLSNVGIGVISIAAGAITINGDPQFVLDNIVGLPGVLPSGVITFDVTFTPDAIADFTAEVQIVWDVATRVTESFTITGSGCEIIQLPEYNLENEPCGTDVNGGCNMAAGTETWTPIAIGETVFSNFWSDGSSRDTDWYELYLPEPMTVTWSFKSDKDLMTGYITGSYTPGYPDCSSVTGISPSQLVEPCIEGSIVLELALGTHWFFAGDNDFEGAPCPGGNYTVTATGVPYLHSIPLMEDFESGFTYFGNDNNNDVDWQLTTSYYKNGIQCAYNDYSNSNDNILHETGILDLSSYTDILLEFWHIAKTESYDQCYVEISTDGGDNYTTLQTFSEDSYAIWGTSATPDNDTWWRKETLDISSYNVADVRIRFRLQSDGSFLQAGWFIDDIHIYEEEGTHIPGGDVSGTWDLPGSPYIIDGEIAVPPGEHLIIEPGGQIVFSDHYKFNISGTLLAEGTASDMILFTAQDQLVGWHGIRFQNTAAMDSSKVIYCNLEYGNATGTGADANGGAISFFNSSNVLIKNSILTNNSADNYGGAIYCETSDPVLINITSSGNNALEGGAIYAVNSNPFLKNSILWGDTAPEIFIESGVIDVNYTNVQGGWQGIGNLDVEPNFLDNTNYILSIINIDATAQNPCVDAGDPADPIGSEPYPNGGRINMGAYGSSSQAAFTAQVDDPIIPPGTIYYPDALHVFNISPTVLSGGDLQIEPGSVIIFYGDFSFEVHGQINIGGVARNDSVLFTSDIFTFGGGPNQSESWQGFIFGIDALDGSTFNNVYIENAINGVNIGSVSASLENTIIIYEDGSLIPSPGSGIFIGDGSDTQITGSEISGYTIGIDIFNEGLREPTTTVLTNNRVRNSPESSRQDDVGIKVSGNVDATIDSCEVYEYNIGIEINNDPSTGTLSTPVLTNNRVRNSPESSRQEAVGIKISGYVAANIDNCDIEDYENGIQYIGSGDTFPERETPVLTNNRVRNSPESSRTVLLNGIYVDSLATIIIDNCDFEDYTTAIEIRNSNTSRVTSTPVLTNNRVRNSPESSREIFVGLRLSGDINGIIEYNEFVQCDSALVIVGNDTSALIQYNLIHITDILTNSVAIYASDADDITINDNTIYQYEYGLISDSAIINFFNNIFWNDSPTVEPVTYDPAFLTGTYNNISRPGGELYPGIGNINSDPMFVDVVAEDFNLEWNSPCIDGGNPASPFDPDDTVNDIGLYYYYQPDYLETPTNIVFSLDAGVINLSWDLVSGAIGYNIYRSFNPYSSWSLHDFNVRDLSWFGPIVGEKRFYLIKAYNSRSLDETLGTFKKKNYSNMK